MCDSWKSKSQIYLFNVSPTSGLGVVPLPLRLLLVVNM